MCVFEGMQLDFFATIFPYSLRVTCLVCTGAVQISKSSSSFWEFGEALGNVLYIFLFYFLYFYISSVRDLTTVAGKYFWEVILRVRRERLQYVTVSTLNCGILFSFNVDFLLLVAGGRFFANELIFGKKNNC